mmetsp:Transcript_35960/g.78419  ORF Transcript_35960/g.78419 Transcript_35960/m.78419 type:complete len:213 (-) Transcript_35960:502-1140(-)
MKSNESRMSRAPPSPGGMGRDRVLPVSNGPSRTPVRKVALRSDAYSATGRERSLCVDASHKISRTSDSELGAANTFTPGVFSHCRTHATISKRPSAALPAAAQTYCDIPGCLGCSMSTHGKPGYASIHCGPSVILSCSRTGSNTPRKNVVGVSPELPAIMCVGPPGAGFGIAWNSELPRLFTSKPLALSPFAKCGSANLQRCKLGSTEVYRA